MGRPCFKNKSNLLLGMVLHTSNPSTQKAEAGGFELTVNLGHIARLSSKTNQQTLPPIDIPFFPVKYATVFF